MRIGHKNSLRLKKPRSSRCFGHQSAIRPMRRRRGNERFSRRVKRCLALAEGACRISGHATEGASAAPTAKHPKHRVALPSGGASTREEPFYYYNDVIPIDDRNVYTVRRHL